MKKHLMLNNEGTYFILETEKDLKENEVVIINKTNAVMTVIPNIKTVIENPVKIINGQIRFYEGDEFPEPHMK